MMNQDSLILEISRIPLFSELSGNDLAAIAKALYEKSFAAGATIVSEDDRMGQTFFMIMSGRVNVVSLTSEGNDAILATFKKGDFFGEMALLDGEPRSASVVAAEPCRLIMLYRREFFDILERYPKICVKLLVEMSRRIRNANRHINTLSLMSMYGRVADVLLRLGREQGHKEAGMTIIPDRPTHQTIANMAGTSRETVTRILSKLQKKRYITILGKKLVIYNEENLID